MSAPDMPEVHWITWNDEDYLASRRNCGWSSVDGSAYFSDVYKHVTDHGPVIPAGPVDRLVQLPDVGEAAKGTDNVWWCDERPIAGAAATAVDARVNADTCLRIAARNVAVARAIDAEKAKPTARERLLARLYARAEGGHEYLEWPVADLRAALAEL
jgi:hypothetical protein